MLRVKCPACGAERKVESSQRGTSFSCSSCGRVLRIPPAAPAKPAPAPAPAADAGYKLKDEAPPAEPDYGWIEEVVAPEAEPDLLPSGQRRQRRGEGRGEEGWWHYYLGGMGGFGWTLVVLVVCWASLLGLTFLWPPACLVLMVAGSGLIGIGTLWIMYVAVTDNPLVGFFSVTTCVFSYVYVFLNPHETWRAGLLSVLGAVMVGSGWALFVALNVALPWNV
jgi:hypothetical protein